VLTHHLVRPWGGWFSILSILFPEIPMSIRSWIRSLFTRPATLTIRKTPRRTRLSLEALEGRWCPSTITVLNIGDDPGALTYTGTDPSTGIANYTAPTLRAAIDGANSMAGPDTINFDTSGVFSTAQTINLGGTQLELTDKTGATTITGPVALTDTTGAPTNTGLGVTVNGGGLSRVFQVDSMVAASISGLTISGGMAAGTSGNGGGLANFGNATLSNCIISENSAGYLSGGVYGGADSTTTLNDCIVSGNSAVFGGGLDSHGTLTLQNHCTVSDNSATQHGGGLENYLGTTTLSDCVVSGNTSTYTGGGLFLNGGETTLTNCTISGNEASRGAGLAAVQQTTSPSHYRGSSDNYIGTTTLTNCTVSGNKATGSFAGGVYNHNSNVTLQSCTISGNSAVDTPGFVSAGGGLLASGGQTTLTDCTVSGNISSRGAGLFANGATLQLVNTTVSGNTATSGSGGGVYNDKSNVTLQNCTISGNAADANSGIVGAGGGLFCYGGQTTLTNCTVSGNSSYRGAGLFAFHTTAQLVNSTVSGNTATSGSSGGVYSKYSNVTLQNCTISGNAAPQSGGGVFLYGGQTTLTGCTLSGNSAGLSGGGVGSNFKQSQVTLTNCTLSGNSAPQGGGLWMSGLSSRAPASATLVNCTVSGNSATSGSGGGIGRNSTGSVTLGNTIVAGNTATGSGPDVSGAYNSQGKNLIGGNPLLAPLGNYGGPLTGAPGAQQVIQTMALLPGSPAIDAGISGTGIPTTDQRGQARVGATDIGAFEVQPGAATTLWESAPAATTAGQPVSVTVTLLDAFGYVATGYVGVVHFSSSDLSAGLPSNYTFTSTDAGTHTFSVTLKKAGTQSITATDTLTGSLTFTAGGIVVSPAAAAQFVLTAPQGVKHGVAFSLTLTVQDAYGNIVTGYVGTVKFTSSDGTAILPANYTFTNTDQGVHTFTGLVLKKTSKQTITLTDKQNSSLTGTLTEQVS
jgi:parallel beta-helix repeat protein